VTTSTQPLTPFLARKLQTGLVSTPWVCVENRSDSKTIRLLLLYRVKRHCLTCLAITASWNQPFCDVLGRRRGRGRGRCHCQFEVFLGQVGTTEQNTHCACHSRAYQYEKAH
jgi:hypothetical protein